MGIKRFVKDMLKRMMLNPVADYLAREINAQLLVPNAPEMEPVLCDFNHYLHELRSNELARMPKGASIFLSAGCSGTWYFDWIKKEYGKLDKHIGIEFYMPKPDDLPAYVEWISDTVGAMKGVADESVDMVFSGQNVEHLQFDDLVGFIFESNRVLKKGGWLIVDSPNRLVTSPLKWLHPEHIAEYTVGEMEEMLSTAGFQTEHKKGLLLVRESADQPPWSIGMADCPWKDRNGWLRRAINAYHRPDDSFVWWLEARKQSEAVDKGRVRTVCKRIFDCARQERVEREQY